MNIFQINLCINNAHKYVTIGVFLNKTGIENVAFPPYSLTSSWFSPGVTLSCSNRPLASLTSYFPECRSLSQNSVILLLTGQNTKWVRQWVQNFSFAKWKSSRDVNNMNILTTTAWYTWNDEGSKFYLMCFYHNKKIYVVCIVTISTVFLALSFIHSVNKSFHAPSNVRSLQSTTMEKADTHAKSKVKSC